MSTIIKKEIFEQMIREAVKELPHSVKRALDNVAFVVEEDDTEAPKRDMRLSPSTTLWGLYQGISKKSRGVYYAGVLPDKISIYRKSIEAAAAGDEIRLRRLVRDVVWHEVGHHLGFSDRELRMIERKRSSRRI